EGRRQSPTFVYAAAPHPGPLPARGEGDAGALAARSKSIKGGGSGVSPDRGVGPEAPLVAKPRSPCRLTAPSGTPPPHPLPLRGSRAALYLSRHAGRNRDRRR